MGIGINGMGRIGRLVLRRLASDSKLMESMPVKAINMSYPAETIAHLLKYDSVQGRWDAEIEAGNNSITINGHEIAITSERDPERIPWASLGVRVVAEATGAFTKRDGMAKHLKGGAEKVVLTAPGTDLDLTVVMGVNDRVYDPAKHHLISTASCTTNCISPVLYVLDNAFGIETGMITSVHAYTSDQRHLDNPHRDLRRARSCGQSIVPTTTGMGKALKEVIPHLSQCIHGLSLRIPTPDVSVADMSLTLKREVSTAEVKDAFLASPMINHIIGWSDKPLVSVDYIGDSHSAVIDGLSLAAFGKQLKVLAWYDNEWGYACRVVDMIERVGSELPVMAKGAI